jgi:hypothetical protein
MVDEDCATASCINGTCNDATIQTVDPDLAAPREAVVRADGAVLLAHYGPGTNHDAYAQNAAQLMTVGPGATHGTGAPAPAGYYPDRCGNSGHIPFTDWNPSGRTLVFECGVNVESPAVSVETTLFADFTSGVKGTYGATGSPGWGMIAASGSNQGRASYANCGETNDLQSGGIAICNGPGVPSFSNHIVSYLAHPIESLPFVGCGGTGCNGPTCNLHVWVWIRP